MQLRPLVLALSLTGFATAHAAAPAPTTSQSRIDALEARIKALEANAEAMRQQAAEATAALEATRAEMEALKQSQDVATAAPEDTSADASGGEASSGGTQESANGNAFNPAISIILNGSYTGHSLDPDNYQRSGFPIVGEGGPSSRGFSLGESEISFAANVDDRFYGQLTVSLGSEEGAAGVEEAFVDTNSLPGGINLRIGRFFSGVGYLNSHHAHTDKFFDRPLPYQAFLGNQYGDDGVQLRWVAPTDTFLEFGAEIFRGDSFPAAGGGHGGAGTHTLFAHAGGDIGDETAWLAGLSVMDTRSEGAEDGFTGDSRLYIADATWKWAPEGNFKDGGVTLRGEYFLEDRDGEYFDANSEGSLPWNGRRRGAYLEAVYRINRRWETGYRFDRLWNGSGSPIAGDFDPRRSSLMLSWLNSEFSLLRLQYSHDEPNGEDTDNSLTLQYQMSLGAHGAHKF